MIHLTHSGFYAGKPFCGCNRETESKKGSEFVHYSTWYHMTDQMILDHPSVCPDCKQFIREALAEETAETPESSE